MSISRSQIQMLLLQQAGPGALSYSNLSLEEFLEYLRKVEQVVLDEKLSPVMVYWSSQDARSLLPTGQRLRDLMRDAFCYSVFSEQRQEPPDEWCFLVESNGMCVVVYGQKVDDFNQVESYQCVGSLDPQIVRQIFSILLPTWQFIDLAESSQLEDARNNLGPGTSIPRIVQRCKIEWPSVKDRNVGTQVLQSIAASPGFPAVEQAAQTEHKSSISPKVVWGGASEADLQATGSAKFDAAHTFSSKEIETSESAKSLNVVDSQAEQANVDAYATVNEKQVVIPASAQGILTDIIGELRHSNDLSAILQLAIERLTLVGKAHRGLIWQVVGDQLAVTNEFSISGHNCFVGNQLGSQESTAIVLEFLSRFPQESGVGVISIPDTAQDTKLRKISSTLASLIELGEVRARLVAQLRCRGVFSGFLELQQCKEKRNWSEEDGAVLQHVANMLSVVVQQALDQSKIEIDAREMKLLNEIASLFRESRGQRSHDMIVKSVQLVAKHLGFIHSQIYLVGEDDGFLIPQIDDARCESVALSVKDNPFVAVFESGRGKAINLEYTRKGHPYFGHDTALVVPLVLESERLGVLGVWERLPNMAQLRPQDRDLALTIAGQLSSIIRAEQAIARIRADQTRADLINRVSSEIRQPLKEVEHIMDTLVRSLSEYFGLVLCAVSLYDGQAENFTKSKSIGELAVPEGRSGADVAEGLFLANLEGLKQGKTLTLNHAEVVQNLTAKGIVVPDSFRIAILVPLIHGGILKAALSLVSEDNDRVFSESDMKMIADLADRVAVVVSHAELFAQVERQAITDPMTGLYNRRHFNEQLSKEIDRYQRFGQPFSYIITDLDFLKKINDNLGHQFGDAAIKHIAQVLKRTTRDVDTAARYGGEEFVILLPVTDVPAARVAAERILIAIRETPVEGFLERTDELEEKIANSLKDGKITKEDAAKFRMGRITASIGISTFPTDAQDREKLTELADQALYLAKHRGRDQLCSVSEDLVPSLSQRGEEALEVQKVAFQKKAEEMASIDLKLIAEHGILGIMGAIIKIIEARDAYSKDRSPKAADMASKLAQALHLSKEHITIISLASILHNVGKIALPEEILQKKGPLTAEERKLVEQSPIIGAKILEPAKHLNRVAGVIEAYHEHWDGSGYPKGLKGDDIPLESRIIALVDAYIAMTSDRPYRKALSHEEALKLIRDGAGKEWDPRLVKLFVSILQKEAPTTKASKR